MDALSYMLQTIRMRTSVFGTVRQRPPWGVRIPPGESAAFHTVIAGRCLFSVEGTDLPEIELQAGDIVVLPHGGGHTFRDHPRSRVQTLAPVPRPPAPVPGHRNRVEDDCSPVVSVTPPDGTTLVCGYLWFDERAANPLVSMLPPLIHFRPAPDRASNEWLEPMLRVLALESDARAPGSDAVLGRLADVIVIQAIRAYLDGLPADGRGWLRALADGPVGAALGLIHEHPETAWTVASLASRVGVSRSTLAVRFTDLVGEAPLRYLTRWRMQSAQRMLRTSSAGVAEIAARVGYQTEPAFGRAFKRWAGISPGEFRRRERAVLKATPATRRGRRAESSATPPASASLG